jgi:hypothetical protein
MKIKRTYKPASLKHGKVEFIDEAKMKEIASQTVLSQHATGECPKQGCTEGVAGIDQRF